MIVNYKTYSELCGLDSVQAVYARVDAGHIVPVIHNNPDGSTSLYIDTEKYPPKRLNKKGQGRKKRDPVE